MGSREHARAMRADAQNVEAVLILETIGYYSDEAYSQHYPSPFSLIYPNAGNFIAFVGMPASGHLVRQTVRAFREHASIASEGIVAPAFVQGVDWSDHSSYNDVGYPAVMITDTAVMRYPHYHTMQDTPDKLNYGNMARITSALAKVIEQIGQATP